MEPIEKFDASILIFGEALTSEERDKLPNSAFGVPEERKFPLIDKGHVLSAISYFHTYDGSESNKILLAKNIYKAAKKYDIKLNKESKFMKYYSSISESLLINENATNVDKEINELNIGGLGYYAPLVDTEIEDTQPVKPLTGTNISNTPNELAARRMNLTDREKEDIKNFKIKLENVFSGSENTKLEYINFFIHFPDKLFEALCGKSNIKDFSEKWNTIIELSRDVPYKELIFELMGKNIDERFDKIIFTENFISDKYNNLFRMLKEGFTYIDHSNLIVDDNNFIISESTKEKVLNGLDKWEGLMDEIFEEYFKVPIFVVLTKGKTAGNKIVSKITGTPYGHASVSFDLSLDKLYSFGTNYFENNPNGRFMTFVEESKTNLIKLSNGEMKYYIYAIFIDKNKKEKMWNNLKKMVKNKTKFSYNYLGIFGYLLNTPVRVKDSFFCSEFIASLFKNVGIELFDKPDSLVAPHDFAFSNKFIKVDEGIISKYKPKLVEKKVLKIMDKYYGIGEESKKDQTKDIVKSLKIKEMYEGDLLEKWFNYNKYDFDSSILLCEKFITPNNSLPIEIDKDGNLIVHKLGNLNYSSAVHESHKLLVLYSKNKNFEGMKYELAKLRTLLRGIETKMYGKNKNTLSNEERKELRDTRAVLLNDYKKYMNEILRNEPDFNFEQYYKDSDFNSDILKITRNSLKGITTLAKTLFL